MAIRPVFNFWDFTKKPTLEGTYVHFFPNIGRFGSTVFIIERNKKRFAIWGTLQIKRLLQWCDFGQHVKIKFLGKKRTKDKKTCYNYSITAGKGNKPLKIASREGKQRRVGRSRSPGTSSNNPIGLLTGSRTRGSREVVRR